MLRQLLTRTPGTAPVLHAGDTRSPARWPGRAVGVGRSGTGRGKKQPRVARRLRAGSPPDGPAEGPVPPLRLTSGPAPTSAPSAAPPCRPSQPRPAPDHAPTGALSTNGHRSARMRRGPLLASAVSTVNAPMRLTLPLRVLPDRLRNFLHPAMPDWPCTQSRSIFSAPESRVTFAFSLPPRRDTSPSRSPGRPAAVPGPPPWPTSLPARCRRDADCERRGRDPARRGRSRRRRQ